MKISAYVLSIAALAAAPVLSIPMWSGNKRLAPPDAGTITSLAPPLGFKSGVNPTGTGDCDGAVNGANGQPIKIPCACPPAQDEYISQLIANVQAGHVLHNPTVLVSYPTDDSSASKSARLNAASVTIQNLNGEGKGCPIVSTTFQAQQKAINDGTSGASSPAGNTSPNTSPSSSSPSSPSPPSPPSSSSSPLPSPSPATPSSSGSGGSDASTIESLAPSLGFNSGVNPTGTGDCDGAVNGADGKPIKVPCSCPPPQAEYISQLIANVQAGHAVNNPTVLISYPLDNSAQSKSTRITAALITLQNLNGAGKGCPASSTTLQAQQKALGA